MTPTQQSALEALAGRALTAGEVEQITPLVAAGGTQAIADILSVGRKVVSSRMTSARGVAEFYVGGPIGAEIVLMKLEGARDAMLSSENQEQQVLGSLLRRQLGFLAGEGLDFGSAALRGMLDQFVALGILTAEEVTGLKAIAEFPNPIDHMQVGRALRGEF
jgi:hypothetical protein